MQYFQMSCFWVIEIGQYHGRGSSGGYDIFSGPVRKERDFSPCSLKWNHIPPREKNQACVSSLQVFIEYVLIKVSLYRLHFSCDFIN